MLFIILGPFLRTQFTKSRRTRIHSIFNEDIKTCFPVQKSAKFVFLHTGTWSPWYTFPENAEFGCVTFLQRTPFWGCFPPCYKIMWTFFVNNFWWLTLTLLNISHLDSSWKAFLCLYFYKNYVFRILATVGTGRSSLTVPKNEVFDRNCIDTNTWPDMW